RQRGRDTRWLPLPPRFNVRQMSHRATHEVMSDIAIYYSLFCMISRNALALIRHARIEPSVIDYLRNRLSRVKLLELLQAMRPVRALVRVRSPYGADLSLY